MVDACELDKSKRRAWGLAASHRKASSIVSGCDEHVIGREETRRGCERWPWEVFHVKRLSCLDWRNRMMRGVVCSQRLEYSLRRCCKKSKRKTEIEVEWHHWFHYVAILRSFKTRMIDAAVGQTSMDCNISDQAVFNQHPPSSLCSVSCCVFQVIFWSRRSPFGSVDRNIVLRSRL